MGTIKVARLRNPCSCGSWRSESRRCASRRAGRRSGLPNGRRCSAATWPTWSAAIAIPQCGRSSKWRTRSVLRSRRCLRSSRKPTAKGIHRTQVNLQGSVGSKPLPRPAFGASGGAPSVAPRCRTTFNRRSDLLSMAETRSANLPTRGHSADGASTYAEYCLSATGFVATGMSLLPIHHDGRLSRALRTAQRVAQFGCTMSSQPLVANATPGIVKPERPWSSSTNERWLL